MGKEPQKDVTPLESAEEIQADAAVSEIETGGLELEAPPDSVLESDGDEKADTRKVAEEQNLNKKQPDKAEKQTKEDEKAPEHALCGEAPPPAKRKWRLHYIIAGVLGVLAIGGYIIYPRISLIGLQRSAPAAVSKVSPTSAPATKLRKSIPQAIPSGKVQELQAAITEAIQLRSRLLDKKEEIYQLKLHYRHAIPEMLKWIDNEVKKKGIRTFDQAVDDKQIEFKLRTIQRRQAYIEALEKPYRWIDDGGERLLFLIRRARFDILMLDVAAGIDLDWHRRHLEAAVQKYQPTAGKLAVDPPDENLTVLKSTWKKITQHKSASRSSPGHALDLEIVDEVCSGRYQRLSQLNEISVRASRCLSRMKGAALVLNNVPELSESAAKQDLVVRIRV